MNNFNNIYAVRTNTPERKLGKKEERKTNNVVWWRTYDGITCIKQVNVVCYAVIVKLSFPLFNNVTGLKNINKTGGFS